MKKPLLFLSLTSLVLAWLSVADAAAPRFSNWASAAKEASDQEQPPETKPVETAQAAGKEKPAETKTTEAKPGEDKVKREDKPAKQKPAKEAPVAASVPQPVASPTPATINVIRHPTKGTRISVNTEDDRKQPTPTPVIKTEKVKRPSADPMADPEQELSWWQRWLRKRNGEPLKPVFVPDSRVYNVRMQDAQWTVTTTRMDCRLYQVVPNLGKAMFQQGVGTDLVFKMELDHRYQEVHQPRFESVPAHWDHYSHKTSLTMPASLKKTSLVIPKPGAIRLLTELQQGMSPRMTYRSGDDEQSDEIMVTLSARFFNDKLGLFLQCLDQLLPFRFEEVKATTLFFKYDSDHLTTKAKKALAKVAEYVRNDEAVKRILIEGHTDSKGFRRYNYRLAIRRAQAVEKFFLDNGISKSRLVLRSKSFGEKKPLASNRSASGRAKNRRVEVTLFK